IVARTWPFAFTPSRFHRPTASSASKLRTSSTPHCPASRLRSFASAEIRTVTGLADTWLTLMSKENRSLSGLVMRSPFAIRSRESQPSRRQRLFGHILERLRGVEHPVRDRLHRRRRIPVLGKYIAFER